MLIFNVLIITSDVVALIKVMMKNLIIFIWFLPENVTNHILEKHGYLIVYYHPVFLIAK